MSSTSTDGSSDGAPGSGPALVGAMSDVTVLELGQIYAGPYCGLLFAQLGADVIKLEPIAGERLRFRSTGTTETHEFMMLNSNKRSVALNLKDDDGRAILRELVAKVDVVIENFAPGAMTRLGLDPHDLCAENPRLIYASGKGYGSDGPYAAMAAMDITVQAMGGTIATTGFPDGPPVKAGPAYVDFSAGVHLYAAAVSALYQRERTGRGQFIEVSMHDTTYPPLASALGGLYNPTNGTKGSTIPERTGNRHSGLGLAPYNVYQADDGHVALICASEKHWLAILETLERPDLVTDPRFVDRFVRVDNVDDVDSLIGAWMGERSRWDAVLGLQANGVPCAPVLTLAEVAEDPHLRQRGMVRTVTHHDGREVEVPGCALHLSDSPVGDLRAAPPLGNATDDVLEQWLDLGPGRRAALRASGAIT